MEFWIFETISTTSGEWGLLTVGSVLFIWIAFHFVQRCNVRKMYDEPSCRSKKQVKREGDK